MKELPLNALRAFAAVYQSGGVRAAAHELGVSHSAVSRHVKELEAWVGAPLFSKKKPRHGLDYTVQGHVLGKAALDTLESLEQAVLTVRESRRDNAVVISTTASVAVRWLIPRLANLQKAHRSIEVSVLTEQAVSDPRSQGADLAIRMGRGPWPDVDCEPFMNDALYPVVHPDLLELITKHDKSPFAKITLIHDRDPGASWHLWFQKFADSSVDFRRGMRFTSSDLVLRAAAQKHGVALARDRLVAEDVQSGALVKPFGDDAIEIRDAYWIVTPRSAKSKRAVAAVIAWLRDEGGACG